MKSHPLEPVARRRDKLVAAMQSAMSGGAVDGVVAGRMVEGVLKVLPKGVPYSPVFRSINSLIGSTPSHQILREVSWALAANIPLLREDKVVWPPSIPTEPTPVDLQVVASKRLPGRASSKAIGFQILYRMRVVVGPGATSSIDIRLSSRFVSYIAVRPQGLGFSRPPHGNRPPPPGRPYQHYETLVGMLIRADLCVDSDGKTKLENFRCTPGFVDYNRSLTEMRWRATFTCPFSFDHPCHHCPKGQTSCKAATHPVDYVTRMCPSCMEDSEFDPYWDYQICRFCSLKPKKDSNG